MSIISVLPEELSNRIAAGEVVERPASVVKELFENAVDAGATAITVEIERAGSRLIKVSDNGCGMDDSDAELCFSPHATSKIKCAEDIECITTLGFRGEALPSIASVSKFSLKTRTASSEAGLELVLEAGRIIERRPAGMPTGTVMSVRDLFYNVPARKKFLRSPATEEAHIQEMVIAMALGFPHVSVTLKFDNKIAIQAPGAKDPAARAAGLFGKSFSGKMLKVDHLEDNITVTGLIALPGFTRTSRREQRTFVNGRAVESQTLYRGIRDGYGTLADFGRFPPTILNIAMEASEYDINVHPTKREVRFKREYAVARALANVIRNALQCAPAPEIRLPEEKKLARPEILMDMASVNYTPQPEAPAIPGLAAAEHKDIFRKDTEPTAKITPEVAEIAVEPSSVADILPAHPVQSVQIKHEAPAAVQPAVIPTPIGGIVYKKSEILRENEPQFTDTGERADLSEYRKVVKTPLAQELSDAENLRYVGIFFGTFIAVESLTSEAMYLIDFHAAHERVLYEELLEKAQNDQPVPSQQLLLPPAIELSRTAAAFISKNEKLFTKLGFDAALLSSNTVLLNAVPANLSGDADWEKVLTDLVATALDGEKNTRDSLETIARAACHSAVKAHDPLNEVTAQALIKSLSKCQRPDVCPHGRPTVLKMTLNELSRRFGRI